MNARLTHASPRTSVASAYLDHVPSKPKGAALKKDPRQTIAPLAHSLLPPPATAPHPHPQRSSRLRRSPANASPASLSHDSMDPSDPPRPPSPRLKVNQHRRSKKPPRTSCKYYSRSVMSEATNSTYLSSDSEEDRTVHSDSVSNHSGRSGSQKSLGSKSSSPRVSTAHHNDTSGTALVPYQAPEPIDATIDRPRGGSEGTSRPQQRRPVVSSNADDLAEMEANVFSYSDEDEFHQQQAHYFQQQQQRQFVSDESSVGGEVSCDYSDDDGHDGFEEQNDDDTLVDLDQLIQETSTRWKLAVTETVKNTVTAASMQHSHTVFSTLVDEDYRLSSSSSHSSNKTADQALSPTTAAPSLHALSPPHACRLIQDQQTQIEALRAALSRQEQTQPTTPQPVHPIQVLTVMADQTLECPDDLTVWSGFHSAAPPPRRPDAASVADGPGTGPALPRAPVISRQLQLSSTVTGLTRTALFTGTVHHAHETNNPMSVTGSGVLQFMETGDVYRGDLVDSEMHGYGSYTFATNASSNKLSYTDAGRPKMLRGRFEHNVFVG